MNIRDESQFNEYYQTLRNNQEHRYLLANPVLKKDIWHIVEDLNLEPPKHNSFNTVNFSKYRQEWLKILAKLYTLIRVNQKKSASTIQRDIYNLQKLSDFLERHSIYNIIQIDETIFEEIDYYLHQKGYKENTIYRYYATFVSFFDTCRQEKWLDINTYWFSGRTQRIYPNDDEIEYIPEEIWHQLDQNLYLLPEPIQRMILLIRTTGLRVGELCNLPIDCLRKRDRQWRLRLTTEKYNIDDELPIPAELAAIIKEQQEYIKQKFKDSHQNLFCNSNAGGWKTLTKSEENVIDDMTFEPIPEVMTGQIFNRWLNRLAKKHPMITKEGQPWHFASHQFRKTMGTILTNAGIRDLIIQRYLRHRSPEMQRFYKHLLKQVLQEEYEELLQEKKYVDISGQIVATHKPKNPITELLRRKMYQVTTQYGECHRSKLKDPCPTVNACWQCKEWRVTLEDLPFLREDLRRVEEELEIAKRLGMERQQQGLNDNRQSLLNCIHGLETHND